MDQIMAIWLDGNLSAHHFVDPQYWKQNQRAVQAAMQQATVYVAEDECCIRGFAGLQENYLAGIFVPADVQGQGIGGRLVTQLQHDYSELSLAVYEQNPAAIRFYLSHNFQTIKRQIDEATQQPELVMQWRQER
ncbi:GNAT family N-acetyltransferase [Pediococcus acidilactici]|nr:GNAT family N-acetyltransferase [Pediococcus acidilactici]KAF0368308.1 GNAT family N-acetyltransferase [Pediococcus acidilactici]KAF0420002.1 GNAT family N-acetyltransferase [Pediococcus acidilactici]KAF0424187.1 GNAT family N-acetyltransferase [Pediococcus acidilactici]KAF0474280.1 GNAT family N-acetyltransferase [Pediococcus acidilactici]